MKSQFVRIVLTTGLAVLGSLTLGAQNNQENAKIPFAFHANHTSLARGDYNVAQFDNAGTFQLTSKGDGHSIFVNAPIAVQTNKQVEPHLTFACYQGDCVLAQVWLPGSEIGYKRSDAAIAHDLQRKLGMATMISVRLGAR